MMYKKEFYFKIALLIFTCLICVKCNKATRINEADVLANKMLKKINFVAYKKTKHVNWVFSGKRYYDFEGDVAYNWNKEGHIIEVKWGDTKVILKPNSLKESEIFIDDKKVSYSEKTITIANDLFNNDSFWLIAPFKLFEPGIVRSIVMINNKKALKVEYKTGGTTPGDSYIWILDKNYLPIKYLMTVPSMKLKDLSATWENWVESDSGAFFPTKHSFSNGSVLFMNEVKGCNSFDKS